MKFTWCNAEFNFIKKHTVCEKYYLSVTIKIYIWFLWVSRNQKFGYVWTILLYDAYKIIDIAQNAPNRCTSNSSTTLDSAW